MVYVAKRIPLLSINSLKFQTNLKVEQEHHGYDVIERSKFALINKAAKIER